LIYFNAVQGVKANAAAFAGLAICRKTYSCPCFWVAQRFNAAIKVVFRAGFPAYGKTHDVGTIVEERPFRAA
jgi:HEPN domain-containing protein